MPEANAREGGHWLLAGGLLLLAAALAALAFPLLRPPPHPPPPSRVVKAMPPPPPSTPTFLKAEEEGLKIVSQTPEAGRPPGVQALPIQTSEPIGPPSSPASSTAPTGTEPPAQAPPPEGSAPPVPRPGTPPSISPTKPATPKEATSFAYTIHLESFKKLKTAQNRARSLRALGLNAFTRRVDLGEKGVFHRVLVGRFETRAKAVAFQARLQKEYSLPKGRVIAASPVGL